jgi:hypothetical protein
VAKSQRRLQMTGNIIFNNRERAENNREEWALSKSTSSSAADRTS